MLHMMSIKGREIALHAQFSLKEDRRMFRGHIPQECAAVMALLQSLIITGPPPSTQSFILILITVKSLVKAILLQLYKYHTDRCIDLNILTTCILLLTMCVQPHAPSYMCHWWLYLQVTIPS